MSNNSRLFPQVFSDDSHNRFRVFLLKLINARYSLPSWLWASSSAFIGLIALLLSIFSPSVTAYFTDAVALGVLWPPFIFISSTLAMYGMATLKFRVVRYASFASFVLWIFGCTAFILTGGVISVMIFGGQILLFWAYKYLASYVRLEDRV